MLILSIIGVVSFIDFRPGDSQLFQNSSKVEKIGFLLLLDFLDVSVYIGGSVELKYVFFKGLGVFKLLLVLIVCIGTWMLGDILLLLSFYR